jgi:hypothetical protein
MKRLPKLLLLLFFSIQTYSQILATAPKKYIDYAITENYIYALSNKNTVTIFNKDNLSLSDKKIEYTAPIILIEADKQGNIVIVDREHTIKRYNEKDNTWTLISKSANEIEGLLFTDKNYCYAITYNGIEDVQTGKIYFSDKSVSNHTYTDKIWKGGKGDISCYYMDRYNRIWIGFSYGEWGGNIFLFDTSIKKFLIPKLGRYNIKLMNIRSFFEDSKNVYLSSGVSHMGHFSGDIAKFNTLDASAIFGSNPETATNSQFILTANYNTFNNFIYFYSQTGFYKGDVTKDLSKFKNWQFIAKPKEQTWYTSNSDETTKLPMTVYDITLLDKNRFIFQSQNDGIGYFDGSKIIMIN